MHCGVNARGFSTFSFFPYLVDPREPRGLTLAIHGDTGGKQDSGSIFTFLIMDVDKELPKVPFLNMYSKSSLAYFLGVSERRLNFLLYVLPTEERYRAFTVSKKSGGTRTIRAPIKAIKDLQYKITEALNTSYDPKKCAHGYISGKGIVSNAQTHVSKRWILRADIEDFFPSINFGRVRGIFLAEPFNFSPTVATLLAQICTFNNELPQGAPTSPVLSNLICRKLDRELSVLAKEKGCYYTRYADDLIFSTYRKDFPKAIGYLSEEEAGLICHTGVELRELVESNGFRINDRKVFLRNKSTRQQVTGLVVNQHLNVKRDFVRNVRAMLYSWEKYGLESASNYFLEHCDAKNRPPSKREPKFDQVVKGKVQFIGSIKGWNNPVYLKLALRLSKLDPSFKFDRSRIAAGGDAEVAIYAEGITNYKHLKAALRYFQREGKYCELRIDFKDSVDVGGSKQLESLCKNLSKVEQLTPCIFVFDRDESHILKEVEKKGCQYKAWGNNVFSFAIPVPKHRASTDSLCIELYYEDGDIKSVDEAGKRLFLREEFDEFNNRHYSGKFYTTKNLRDKKKSPVIGDDVFDVETGSKVTLSKNQFADHVLNENPLFSNIHFDAFKHIFDTVIAIIEASKVAETS